MSDLVPFIVGVIMGAVVSPSIIFFFILVREYRAASKVRTEEAERAKFIDAMRRDWETR